MRLLVSAASAITVCAISCTDEDTTHQKSKLDCEDPLAEFDANLNACTCPDTHSWQGDRCQPLKTADPRRESCRESGGRWSKAEDTCSCPIGKQLVGAACETRPHAHPHDSANVSEEEEAPQPQQEQSEEEEVAKLQQEQQEATETSLSRQCRLAGGSWLHREQSCECLRGLVWIGEKCQRRSSLSSREICESAYSRGTWDRQSRICRCPIDRFWIHQRCVSLATIRPETACVSETNRGEWQRGRCTCPPNRRFWDHLSRRCLAAYVTDQSRPCIVSGGAIRGGSCHCPASMAMTRTSRGLAYCQRADHKRALPAWFRLLWKM